MTDVLKSYREVDYDLPKNNLRWALYGAGLDNLGKDGKPVSVLCRRSGQTSCWHVSMP